MTNVENCLAKLSDVCWQLPKKKSDNTFVGGCVPDMDQTPALEKELESWYQSFIGMIMLMVEIFGVDIITEVYMMVS